MKVNKASNDLIIEFGDNELSVRSLIETKIKILDVNKNIVPLVLNESQNDLYLEIVKCVKERKPIRFIILKARQLGFTTFIGALIFVLTFFQANQSAVIVADNLENAKNIFAMYKNFYRFLPKELRTTLKSDNVKELKSETYGSSIRVLTQGDQIGRGSTIVYVHLSEASRYDDLEGTVNSVSNSVPLANRNSMVFMESTAKGFNTFKDYWDKAVSKQNAYIPKFYPWFLEKRYREPYDGFALLPHEEKIKNKFNLDNEQIARYRMKYLEVNQKLDVLLQENPSEPLDAFIASGNNVFNLSLLEKRKELAYKLIHNLQFLTFKYRVEGSFEDVKVVEEKKIFSNIGDVAIYELPIENHPYIIGIDTARAKGIDYSVMQVIDNFTLRQVATYRKTQVDIDEVSAVAVLLGYFYNDALLVPETNSTEYLVKFLVKANYRNVYIRTSSDTSMTENYYETYGVKTTAISKKTMIDWLIEICRESNYENIIDYTTLSEMETFVYDPDGNGSGSKMGASGKLHDDTVMALAIAYYGRSQQSSIPNIIPSSTKKKNNYDPLDLYSNEQEETEVAFEW